MEPVVAQSSSQHLPTAVVTGGARGLGFPTAARLADRGLRVVVVARDPQRGAAAVAALQDAAPHRRVELVVGDLASRRSVGALADALLTACPRLDVLVHNAGVWPSRCEHNEDGIEIAFATNHLAPFALNERLEDRLAASRGRVVQVGAGLYVKGRVDLDRTPVGADFSSLRTYADTKLANLMTIPLWARRWAAVGVTIDALHPGVLRTGLGDRRGPMGLVLKAVKRTWAPADEGAAPVVRLALDHIGGSGRWFVVDDEAPLEGAAADAQLAQRVFDQAAALTGGAERAQPAVS